MFVCCFQDGLLDKFGKPNAKTPSDFKVIDHSATEKPEVSRH